MAYRCDYCPARLPTQQGLRSHIGQSAGCAQKHHDRYTAESSAEDSESDSDLLTVEGLGASQPEVTEAGGFEEDSPDEDMLLDPPSPSRSDNGQPEIATPAEIPPRSKRPRATVEEVEDEDDSWTQDFPEEQRAGAILEECRTQFEKLREGQKAAKQEPWYPFESQDEWELAQWLMTSGLSQTKREEYLKLKAVREGINPSFHNNRAFLNRIDNLPKGAQWYCHPFKMKGDDCDEDGEPIVEVVELWYRDPLDCIRELLGNPAFTKQGYEPCRLFRTKTDNGEGSNREYNEMWTADWWWNIQELLPKGSTLCPIILSSDKTQLTRFSGDQQAWPVYLTIGNIDKETRRTPSSRATVLLGYIPVTKLEHYSKARRSAELRQLFHDCMKIILAPLIVAGNEGVRMDCADGFVRKMFPILSAYIADYPEQCLIACCRENSCPRCLVNPPERGLLINSPFRDHTEILHVLSEQAKGNHPPKFITQNLRPVNPFWADLPHCDIFSCMTPDILHEIHNGVFGDHTVSWSSAAMTGLGPEIDLRFRAMTRHPDLRHFKKGISLTSQWTGNEHKNMEKVYLGVLANATEPRVQRAVRGVIDFTYYAHFETHCDDSLAQMDAAWAAFHSNKDVFKDLDIRGDFDVNKLHKLKHYTDSIRSRGTADGFNTENTERLHIDLAKVGYKATNRKAYTQQMTTWLRRQDAVHKFGSYLQWAVPGYIAEAQSDEPEDDPENDDTVSQLPDPSADDEDDEDEVGTKPAPLAPIYTVAKTPGFPALTAASISTDFHAPEFLHKIAEFLDSKSINTGIQPSPASIFPVYKRLSLTLPAVAEVSSKPIKDKIRAVKAEAMKLTAAGVKPSKPGQFDTVLVQTASMVDGQHPTDGLRVARVRVIFRLPEEYGIYADPLAYIDWFKPLTQPVTDLGMYQVSLSSRNLRQNSQIIPVTDIIRSCHLIPVFGRSINPGWTSERVLDVCKSFYLNPYLRHHDFYLFRYLTDLYTSKKAAEERRVRVRLLGRAGY